MAWGPNKNKKKLFMNNVQNYSVNSATLITQPIKGTENGLELSQLALLRSFTESSPNANSI